MAEIAPHKVEYTDLMNENNLKRKDLPKEINNKITGITFALGKFKSKPSENAKEKIAASDADICIRINNWLDEGGNKDASTPPKKVEEKPKPEPPIQEANPIQEPAKQVQEQDAPSGSPEIGFKIEEELEAMLKAGKNIITLEELKSGYPFCYKEIFNAYEEGAADNGIQTSKYLLKETETKLTFKLSQL